MLHLIHFSLKVTPNLLKIRSNNKQIKTPGSLLKYKMIFIFILKMKFGYQVEFN